MNGEMARICILFPYLFRWIIYIRGCISANNRDHPGDIKEWLELVQEEREMPSLVTEWCMLSLKTVKCNALANKIDHGATKTPPLPRFHLALHLGLRRWSLSCNTVPRVTFHVPEIRDHFSVCKYFLSFRGGKANPCLLLQTLGRVPWQTASMAVKTQKRGRAVCVHPRDSAWPQMEELV